MRKSILIACMALLSVGLQAQKTEMKAVKQTITAFAQAGDAQDAESLEKHLDANYRIVMNQLFGSKEVSVMPRAVYLDKIRKKEFGGDPRKLTFKEVIINGNTAVVRVDMAGSKMTMYSLITLVKNAEGKWLLISDVPVV
jgi:ketosteroid isomerase-like protein